MSKVKTPTAKVPSALRFQTYMQEPKYANGALFKTGPLQEHLYGFLRINILLRAACYEITGQIYNPYSLK